MKKYICLMTILFGIAIISYSFAAVDRSKAPTAAQQAGWGFTFTGETSSKDIGEMITIPAGQFLMGYPGRGPFVPPQTLPQHTVELLIYQIGKYEVTRGEYRKFVEAGGYNNKKYWSVEGWQWKLKLKRIEPEYWTAEQDLGFGHFIQSEDHPVTGVSYYEAEAYCKWAGGRLPTEAQWEKAAGWNENNKRMNVYPWGDSYVFDPNQRLFFTDNDITNPIHGGHGYSTYPVGSHAKGASPYGCMDMAGNVYEWCADWYKSYPGNSVVYDGTNKEKAVRGGNWLGGEQGNAVTYRNSTKPSYSWYGSGFRLAR